MFTFIKEVDKPLQITKLKSVKARIFLIYVSVELPGKSKFTA